MAQIAYLVLTHGLPYQTIDFLWSVWREEDAYFVHVDAKSPAVAPAAIGAIAAAYPNIHVVPSHICTWGGYSLVEAALHCLAAALAADSSWSHAVLASGTHLPLRRAESLAAMLEPDCCYLNFHKIDLEVANLRPPNFWSGVAQRLTYEYREVAGIGHMRGPVRRAPPNVEFFWGTQWWILSRSAAQFVCTSRHHHLDEYFRSTLIPDESYFQTILLNSPFKNQLKHQQIIWQKWSEHGRPMQLSDDDIASALTSTQLFARKASEATMRDETGVVAQRIATVDRARWVQSMRSAFADFLPSSMLAAIDQEYCGDGERRGRAALPESEILSQSLLNEASQMISRRASAKGLAAEISSSVSAGKEATLTCQFPESRTQANYLLILRVCNLQVAWVGLYVRFADLAKAAADLEKFPDQQLIDFSFPQVPGFYLHHDLLEYGVRQTGVVWLDTPPAAENLEAVIREYLEILSKIPGVMATPMPAGGCEGVSSEEVREALQLPERGGSCALNLALRKPACQSSVSRYSLGATPGEDARGGNNGHTSGRYGFHTATERDPWWQVDLEDVFLLRRVVIFNRREQAERLKRFTLLGSRDGRDWEELFRKTDDRVFGSSGEPFTAEIDGERLARFVRVRLDGEAPLHFNECQVFGEHPDPVIHARMREEEAQAEKLRSYIPDGRRGRIIEIGGLAVFVDEENYDASIIAALERGDYEGPERHLVSQAVTQVDRILELGTAIGVMSMTAARIVGPENVVTFDANPDIANDARDNFRRNGLEAIRSQVGIMRNRQMITDPHETVPFYIHKVFLASRLNAWAADSNIVKTVEIPISCLEDTIADHGATVLICDIEGGEVELLGNADLSGIRLIILEAHYAEAGEAATDDLVRRLIGSGFSLDLDLSHTRYLVLRRRLSQ